ncbi:MAG: transposase, partial [Candidatus Saccharicenans sp.]
MRNRAQVWTFQALKKIKQRLPFALLGIDSDNDGAFINDHLVRYCQENNLTFTRSRPYRKNDSCYVEQKNYSVVRRLVGYLRYDTEEEQRLLEQLYCRSRLKIKSRHFVKIKSRRRGK